MGQRRRGKGKGRQAGKHKSNPHKSESGAVESLPVITMPEPAPPADRGMLMPTREFHGGPLGPGGPLPTRPPQQKSFRQKLSDLADSNLFWSGGVAMALAAYAFEWAKAPPLLSIVLLIAAWLIVTVAVHRHSFFDGKSRSMEAAGNILISGSWAVILIGAWFFLQPKPSLGEPEIVLVAPKNEHRYRWIPLERVAVDQGLAPPKDLDSPIFRLKNLSDTVATSVHIFWRVADSTPIKTIFLSSEHFKQYKAEILPSGGVPTFFLQNSQGEGMGGPASDEETMDVQYMQPTAIVADGLDVPLPGPIASSYGLRLAGTLLRPDKTNQPAKGGGMIQTVGPSLDVVLAYRQSGKDYTRRFRVESSVLVLSDTVNDYAGDGDIEPRYWSPDNFRAIVTFSVSARN